MNKYDMAALEARAHWIDEARSLGAEHARNAASWIVDGNTKPEAIAHVVALMDAGDDIYDYLPAMPNLSGEWADDLNPARLFEQVTGLDLTDATEDAGMAFETLVGSLMDELCTAYEDAVSETFEPECERILRAALA